MEKELDKKLKAIEKVTRLEFVYVRNLPQDASLETIHAALLDDYRLLEDTFHDMLSDFDNIISDVWEKLPE